jgi:hypothetical protein
LEAQMQISEKHPEHGTDSVRGMKKFTALEAVSLLNVFFRSVAPHRP